MSVRRFRRLFKPNQQALLGGLSVCFVGMLSQLAFAADAVIFAPKPDPASVKSCLIQADKNLFAGILAGKGRLCSEIVELTEVEVMSLSKSENMADVLSTEHFRVLGPDWSRDVFTKAPNLMSSAISLCTGISNLLGHVSAGQIVTKQKRQISLQQWSSGWRCKS